MLMRVCECVCVCEWDGGQGLVMYYRSVEMSVHSSGGASASNCFFHPAKPGGDITSGRGGGQKTKRSKRKRGRKSQNAVKTQETTDEMCEKGTRVNE